jgi:Domain of unknown function (DUF4136)
MQRLAAAAAVVLLAACDPGGAETLTDFDSVTTQHDRAADFATLHTYAMPDAVLELPSNGVQVPLDHSHDAEILGRVATNLELQGWTRVDPAVVAPDVDVLVSFSVGRYVNYRSYAFYEGDPGWAGFAGFDATWGITYPWASPAAVHIVDAGALRIDMLDVRDPDPAAKLLRAVWSATVLGFVASIESNVQRIDQGIDQAFAQSPYL